MAFFQIPLFSFFSHLDPLASSILRQVGNMLRWSVLLLAGGILCEAAPAVLPMLNLGCKLHQAAFNVSETTALRK